MAMSGVKLTEACMATYTDIQKSKKYRYAIFIIKDGQIDVEKVSWWFFNTIVLKNCNNRVGIKTTGMLLFFFFMVNVMNAPDVRVGKGRISSQICSLHVEKPDTAGFRSQPVLGWLRLRLFSTRSRLQLLVKEHNFECFLKYDLAYLPVHIGPNLC